MATKQILLRCSLLAACLLSLAVELVRSGDDDHVLRLTDDTFDEALKKYKSVLINFHPFNSVCKSCEFVDGEFAAAAKMLVDEGEVKLAMAIVDTSKSPKLDARFKIKTHPTIKYFHIGDSLEQEEAVQSRYTGHWHSHNLVAFLRKMSGQAAYRQLRSRDDIEELAQDNDAAVIGIFKEVNGPEAKAFMAASKQVLDEEVNFGLVSGTKDNDVVATEFGPDSNATAKIYVMKKFDELLVAFDGDAKSVSDVVAFVRRAAFPYVQHFSVTSDGVHKTFGHTSIHANVVLFSSMETQELRGLYSEFRQVAKRRRGDWWDRLNFVFFDCKEPEYISWLEYFKISPKQCPFISVLVLDGTTRRYTLRPQQLANGQSQPLTADVIEQHVSHFVNGTLQEDADYYKDEL